MKLARLVWISVAIVCGWPSAGLSQLWLPGPAPVVGEIQSQCVETLPEPQTRTTIGIGENVLCWLYDSSDIDYWVDESGQFPGADTLTITWSASGLGTVYPIVGLETTLTADWASEDGTVTVTADVTDSGEMGLDAPVQKQASSPEFVGEFRLR